MSKTTEVEAVRAAAVIVVQPFAERLRFKGQRLRWTNFGETRDFRVIRVSMPDAEGRCTLTLEAES